MPNSQPPEFDWLYGDQPGSTQPPAEPRRRRRRRDPAVPLTHTTQTLGGPPGVLPPAGKRPRWGRWLRRTALVVVAIWVVFLIATPLMAWQKVNTVRAFPKGNRVADTPGSTYLIVGSDSRKGLSRKQKQRTGTGGVGNVGARTDTIMLMHLGRGPAVLLSIPRDSLLPIPGHGTTKVNAAYTFGGPRLLVETLESATGVRIDHYIEVGFMGFVEAIDAVGGIEICPEKAMRDPRANLNIKKGCQLADSVTALGYARSRYTSPIGDIDRTKNQREVLAALGSKVKSPWSVLNPVRYSRLINSGVQAVKVSRGTSMQDLAKFAWAMTQMGGDKALTCGMPIRDLAVNWDQERAQALFGYIKADATDKIPKKLCRPTGLPD